jgi:hypothetical protein
VTQPVLNKGTTAGLSTIALAKTKKFLQQQKHTTMALKLKPAGKVLIIAAVVAAGILSSEMVSKPTERGDPIYRFR